MTQLKKILPLLLLSIISFSSCESFMQGISQSMGMMYGGTPMGYYGVGTGNMDYLLDPNYAIAQTMQQQNYFNNVFTGLAQVTAKQVEDEERAEWNYARQYEPDLTLEQYRWRKAQAYSMMKEAERNGNTLSYSSNSSVPTYSGSGCRSCHGTGKCMGYHNQSVTLLNLYCHGSSKCTKCYGQRTSTNGFGSTGSCTQCGGTGKCKMCSGSGRCSACGGR